MVTGSPSSLAAAYKELQAEEPAVLAAAPPEIKGDFQTLFTFFNKLYSELASVGYDISKLPASYAQSLASSTGALTTASTAITNYLATHCGISSTGPTG